MRTSALLVIGVCVLGSSAAAQTPATDPGPSTVDDLLRQLDAQEAVIEEQGRRLDALQRQIDDLRAPPAAPQPAPRAAERPRREPQPETPAADLVQAGDFPESFRIPGTDAAFKVGGLVRANWVTTLKPLLVDDKFVTAEIPIDVAGAPVGGRVEVIASPSRFNLDLRTPTGVGHMRAFVESDFAGSGNTFRLRHAFGEWRRLLFGQTWSTFADRDAEPGGIDFEGLNAIVLFRQPQIRWSWAATDHVHVAFAVEAPEVSVAGLTAAANRPDVVTRLRWEPVTGRHLQVAALYRRLQGFPSNAPANLVGANAWGLNASGRWRSFVWSERDEILFQVNGGRGIGRYIKDLSSAGEQDGVYDAATNTVRPLGAASGYAGYEHWWTDRFHSTFTLGSVRVDNLAIQPGDAYHLTRRYSTNFMWSPIARLDLVIELLSGVRVNEDQHRAGASQIQIGSTFRF